MIQTVRQGRAWDTEATFCHVEGRKTGIIGTDTYFLGVQE